MDLSKLLACLCLSHPPFLSFYSLSSPLLSSLSPILDSLQLLFSRLFPFSSFLSVNPLLLLSRACFTFSSLFLLHSISLSPSTTFHLLLSFLLILRPFLYLSLLEFYWIHLLLLLLFLLFFTFCLLFCASYSLFASSFPRFSCSRKFAHAFLPSSSSSLAIILPLYPFTSSVDHHFFLPAFNLPQRQVRGAFETL